MYFSAKSLFYLYGRFWGGGQSPQTLENPANNWVSSPKVFVYRIASICLLFCLVWPFFVALSCATARHRNRRRVRLPVTRSYWIKTNDRRIMWFSPTGNLVFWDQLSYPRSQGLLTLILTLEILVWKKTCVSMRPCMPPLLLRRGSSELFLAMTHAWGRAAIGCRPEAADAKCRLLAPATSL